MSGVKTLCHDALINIWPAQINVVDLVGFGPVQTLKLRQQQPEQHVDFSPTLIKQRGFVQNRIT